MILGSRRANAHLLVNPIQKLTKVLIWKTLACLKFGKTSNRVVENFLQRKLLVWAANDARSHKEFDHTELRRASASSETIHLHTLEFRLASTRCPSTTTSERVTNLHILVPAITRGTLARPHELKTRPEYYTYFYLLGFFKGNSYFVCYCGWDLTYGDSTQFCFFLGGGGGTILLWSSLVSPPLIL